jgi:hypothetical protein
LGDDKKEKVGSIRQCSPQAIFIEREREKEKGKRREREEREK